MKRIAIGVLIIGVIVVVALSTRSRLPRVEEANGTAPGEVAAAGDREAGDSAAGLLDGAADSLEQSSAPDSSQITPSSETDAGSGTASGSADGTTSSPRAADQTGGSNPPASDASDARDASPATSPSQLTTEQILERASAAYADVRSMQADFAMAMTNPLLRRTTNSRGTLYQRRPDRIALRFSEPQGDVIVGDGTHFWIYYPSVDERQVIRMPASQGASGGVDLQSQFVGDPTERFRSTLHGTERVGGRDAYVLTLEPRAPAGYTALKVWLDTRDYLARRFEIVQENGAVRRFDLSNLRTNLTLGDATFRFTPPADARIVDRS